MLSRADHAVAATGADVVGLVAIRRIRAGIAGGHATASLTFLCSIAEYAVARASRSIRLVYDGATASPVTCVFLALRRPAANPLRIAITVGRPTAVCRITAVVAGRRRRVALLSLSVADNAVSAGGTQIMIFIARAAQLAARIAAADASRLRVADLGPVAEDAVVRAGSVVGREQAGSSVAGVRRASDTVVAISVQYTSYALVAILVTHLPARNTRVSAAYTTLLRVTDLCPVAEQTVVGTQGVVRDIAALVRGCIATVRSAVDIVVAVTVLRAAAGRRPELHDVRLGGQASVAD